MATDYTTGLIDRIQCRLRALGLNYQEASEKAGLRADFVSSLVRSKQDDITGEKAVRLAVALETSVGWLLGEPSGYESGQKVGRTTTEDAISDLGGDVLLLDYAGDALREADFDATVLQDNRMTALLHSINRIASAMQKLEVAFFGEAITVYRTGDAR